jgi:hypothetical protein
VAARLLARGARRTVARERPRAGSPGAKQLEGADLEVANLTTRERRRALPSSHEQAATRGASEVNNQGWVRMLVRVRQEELEVYRRAAARAGLSVSEWVREVLERASRKSR